MFGWLLHVIYHADFAGVVSIPIDLRVPPPGYDSLLPRIPIDMRGVVVARHVALLFCSMALVGLFTRTSALVTGLCALYLLGLEELFGKIYHQYQHLVWFALLLSVAPSGDALSIDAMWASWRRADHTTPPGPSVAYALPLRFVWLLIGVIYFFPGLAKLRAGPEWVLSDNLKYLMYSYWSRKHFVPWFRIDHYPHLYRSAALATIVFETTFIACVFSRRLRPVAVAGGVIFHWMTATYLGLPFWSLVVCYTAFVDWAGLFERLGWGPLRRPASVFFAGPQRNAITLRAPSTLPGPAVSGVVIVGSVLLIANIYCGVQAIDSWPFSIYPQFGEIVRSPIRRSLEVVVRSAGGELRPAGIAIPEGVETRILETGDATERARYLRGLRALIQNWPLKPRESVLVFEVERSVIPEELQRDPQRHELLLEVPTER